MFSLSAGARRRGEGLTVWTTEGQSERQVLPRRRGPQRQSREMMGRKRRKMAS